MKKLLIMVLIICTLYTGTAYAVEPAEEKTEMTVEDVVAVTDQIADMDAEMNVLARVVYLEARGVKSKAEQAGVIWCILNRVDSDKYPDDITKVATARHQFAYSKTAPVKDRLKELARDVVTRWLLEKCGIENVGRTLPKNYLYFAGRRGHNWFRPSFRCRDYWDWSLSNPY